MEAYKPGGEFVGWVWDVRRGVVGMGGERCSLLLLLLGVGEEGRLDVLFLGDRFGEDGEDGERKMKTLLDGVGLGCCVSRNGSSVDGSGRRSRSSRRRASRSIRSERLVGRGRGDVGLEREGMGNGE